ncbi:class II fructose-bisphosphatase [Gorillibacterium timonense]|uniref:class II fructose-bisphosphatase n=1 Tax=Gorillibacterium timonense TaxID=1689269 RepID=UPI00071D678F|nr:class II fructose-bisphosphatase [Gorillibacterium timonense]
MNGFTEPVHHLGLSLAAVCEQAAIASAEWIGCGNKNEADGAATEAMRSLLNRMPMQGTVVIGEGELDEAPMLYIGEKLGTGQGPRVDIAVDPLEGTALVADGLDNSLSVIAIAPEGCLLHAPDTYMEKLAVGPAAAGQIDITAPLLYNLQQTAKALGKDMREMTVSIQNRPRHREAIETVRRAGAKVALFQEGDVSCSIATALSDTAADLFYSIGGAPEGVVSAVALHCLGGELQGRLKPENEEQALRCRLMGVLPDTPLFMQDFLRSDDCLFAATGITDSMLLSGVRRNSGGNWAVHTMLGIGQGRQVYFMKSEKAGIRLPVAELC